MRRLITAAALAVALTGVVADTASAGKFSTGCPNANSGYLRVDRAEWMRRTLLGFAAEGFDTPAELDAIAVEFGFESWAALAAWIVGEQWDRFNHNGNEFVCMKDLPRTPGLPAYVFGGIDDQASAEP